MRRSPLLAVGFILTVLGVALFLQGMQRDVEAAGTSLGLPVPSWIGGNASVPPAPVGDADSTLRLRIPAIGLDRPMSGEGLSRDGRIDPDPGSVMWFDGSDRVAPGDKGTAVIAAHVSVEGKPDAFARLSEVGVGDSVDVADADGTVSHFVVKSATAIPKSRVTTDQAVWGPNSRSPRLAILTCDDAFGFRGDGHRVANLVLIAERR